MSDSSSSRIRLSFCIPTYNRASFIRETLDSIIIQATSEIEIVIVDGGSTDNTQEVVKEYTQLFSNINYCRQQTNNGVDVDMARSVSLARGDYCWLTSSDDPLALGAIEIILEELESKYEIYLCNINLCSKSLKPFGRSSFLSSVRSTDLFNLGNREELLKYFSLATSNNALFCYMGSIIFKRERWGRISFNNHFSDTGYAHVYSLFCIVKQQSRLKYVDHALVMNRADNDNFSSGGIENRYLIDFNGYLKLADILWNDDSELRKAFLKVMTREHGLLRLVKLRTQVSKRSWQSLQALLLKFGYCPKLLSTVNFLNIFRPLVKSAVYLWPKIRRMRSLRWYLAHITSGSSSDR